MKIRGEKLAVATDAIQFALDNTFSSFVEETPEDVFGTALVAPIKTILDCALECAAKGWHVIPCAEQAKLTASEHGVNDATSDPAVIQTWWSKNPNFNYGVAGGDASNLVLIDIDEATAEEETGLNLPETFQVKSGRAPKPGLVQGSHRYYRGSCKTHSLFAAAVEPITQRETLNKKGEKIVQSFDAHGRLVVKNRVTIGEVRSRGAYVIGYGSIQPIRKPVRDYQRLFIG